ncbi:hypothetical protein B5F07_19650 [Lachnoclostridium sp. An169]|uniref:AraC family transcriptional regulator n=1 Tax=Lachnoclostridium sp. An169 TaxID=1965569 RepID=UPI000B37B0B3|nr:AraC family transcriptional regulator [Lachnoclostridium sp. An169]OUP80808.1 hypothetical protein B5F07_19650 [Lachnoclostridium sp. An169]HJA68047.1 AraC family transcriptional regulator [Candidatus Mediterraneibacter cottocaccae]
MAELYEKELFIFNQVPVRIFNHAFERENIFTPLHWHRNIEFNLTTGGRIRYMIDGCESEEHPGDWNVVNSGELHSNHWIGREDIFTGVSVQISKSFMDTWMGEKARFCLPEEKSRRERGAQILTRFGELKKRQGNSRNAGVLEEMELVFHFLRFLQECCIAPDAGKSSSGSKPQENIKKIINYLDRHYMENVTLTGVAEEFHYTPAHLSRMFREQIGFNFHEYLQSVRLMNCVNEMKKDPQIQLMACALNNGFPNARSFIETFRKTFGCTPSEWIKS